MNFLFGLFLSIASSAWPSFFECNVDGNVCLCFVTKPIPLRPPLVFLERGMLLDVFCIVIEGV